MMKSGLESTSSSSLRTFGWIPSCTMDMWQSRWSSMLLIFLLSCGGYILLPVPFFQLSGLTTLKLTVLTYMLFHSIHLVGCNMVLQCGQLPWLGYWLKKTAKACCLEEATKGKVASLSTASSEEVHVTRWSLNRQWNMHDRVRKVLSLTSDKSW